MNKFHLFYQSPVLPAPSGYLLMLLLLSGLGLPMQEIHWHE